MADPPADPRTVTVLNTLTAADPRLSKDELAVEVMKALDATPIKNDLAERIGCGVALLVGILLAVMGVAAAGIGLIWLYQAVL